MNKVSVAVTVFFEEPFWVGVVERIEGEHLSVYRIVFGAEPGDYEVYSYLLKNYQRLRFSPAVEFAVRSVHLNPKRVQRKARQQMQETGIGTKSQQALKLQQEQKKTARRACRRRQKEAEALQKFELKQQKRKKKRKGR